MYLVHDKWYNHPMRKPKGGAHWLVVAALLNERCVSERWCDFRGVAQTEMVLVD